MAPRIISTQERVYETAYRAASGDYGIPDRKIAGGQPLLGQRILVLGCGAGNDVWYLAPDNRVVGLDFAQSGLAAARIHGLSGARVDLNARPDLPFADGTFDLVVCKDILEHLLDPLLVLQDVRRVLRDTGYVVISVPNHFYLPLRLRILLGRNLLYRMPGHDHSGQFEEWDYTHIRFFTYKGFRRFLGAAGLRPDRWFWDFGSLAHYNDPDMWFEPQLWKRRTGRPVSRRAAWALALGRPLWLVANALCPRALRWRVVALAPSLLCAGFYCWARKEPAR